MLRRSLPLLAFAPLAAGVAAACDCLYSFHLNGTVTMSGPPKTLVARDCYGSECGTWQTAFKDVLDDGGTPGGAPAGTRAVAYGIYSGGNGSRCERPSRIEFKADGCTSVSVVPTSDAMRHDFTMSCAP